MNKIFQEYTTSTAFLLQLSKLQCNALLRIQATDKIFDVLNVTTLRSLEAKGLVKWDINGKGFKEFNGLTKAGELMCELLKEAGLTIESTNTVSVIKYLNRAA